MGKFLTRPGVIFYFLLGIFQDARILVHVGCVTPIKTAASIQNRRPAT